jgi:hypothetical protein
MTYGSFDSYDSMEDPRPFGDPEDPYTGDEKVGGNDGETSTQFTPEEVDGPPDGDGGGDGGGGGGDGGGGGGDGGGGDEDNVIDTLILPPNTNSIDFTVKITVEEHVIIPLRSILGNIILEESNELYRNDYPDLRVGKTLLNLRNDRQIPILNWKLYANGETNFPEIALKLSEPLDTTQYPLNTSVFISREMLSSAYDRIRFIPRSELLVPSLRPSRDTSIAKSTRVTATLSELIPNIAGGQGDLGSNSDYVNFVSNNILENHYNRNMKGIEINVDHSKFENFVTFGSAQQRLDVFKRKLEMVEILIKDAPIFIENLNISASSADSGSYETVFGTLEIDNSGNATLSQTGSSAVYDHLYNSGVNTDFVNTSINTSIKIQELIRGFDKYENELWFDSGLEYSASNGEFQSPTQYYKTDYTYPKILGIPLATTHASSSEWYTEMTTIATDYDVENPNSLDKNVPNFVYEDSFSVDFLTFVKMVGHHFDNIKVYIKNLQNLSSRYPKENEEISGDMAKLVLQSFGMSAPSIASTEKLITYITGDNKNIPYKEIANEYYKRYVHALPFLTRTKGTKQSLNSLINVFGINSDAITFREGISNRYTTLEPVKVSTTEQSFALTINSGSFLTVPFSSSLRSPQTIQSHFALIDDRTQPIFRFDNDYTIQATFHPDGATNTYYQNTGRIELLSGSTALVSSSYFDLFDQNFTSLQLKYDSAGAILDIRKLEGEYTTFTQSLQETQMSMSADWSGLGELYIGIPAASASGAEYTSASIDEFRMWGDTITEAKFIEFAENPGMYAGNTYTSSLEDLYVRLSFNLPTDVNTTGSIPNTTPYTSKSVALDLTDITATEFPSRPASLYNTTRYVRTVTQNSYNASGFSEATDMIRIAPDAPATMSLARTSTTIPIYEKFMSSSVGTNDLDISISPTDAVDREIIRAFGNINLGHYLGDPLDTNKDEYQGLSDLEDVFVRELAPTIDYNGFVRFFDKFLHLFYESADQFIPARARVKKGVVIRSSILNRTKVNNRENIKFSGETSRRSLDFERDAVYSFDVNLDGLKGKPIEELLSTEVYGLFGNQDSSITLDDWGAKISVTDLTSLNARYDYLEGNYSVLEQDGSIFADTLGNTSSFGALEGIISYRSTENLSTEIESSLVGYGPKCDLFNVPNGRFSGLSAANSYFTNGGGLYYVNTYRTVPNYVNGSMTFVQQGGGPIDRGTWVSGQTYSRGDIVTHNGIEYAFYPPSPTQVVYSPTQDYSPWRVVPQIQQIYQNLVRTILVTGSYLEPGKTKYLGLRPGDANWGLAPEYVTGSSIEYYKVSILTDLSAPYGLVPIGYRNEFPGHIHFELCRDKTFGGLRRTYLGTLNTKTTSIDGGYPYEIFQSEENVLTVGTPEPCPDCD